MRLSPSIDWLSVKQEAPAGEDYPVFGESKVYRVSLLDGQVSGEFIKGQRAQGSFDTSIYVSCDQRALHISGNPSRWGRLDNVFGFSSMADCLAVYDGLLESLGLPLLDHLRCVLTRVDLAQNFDVGQGNQLSYLRALAQHSLRAQPYLYPNGRTVDYNRGSRWVYRKYYDKGHEPVKKSKTLRAPQLQYQERLRRYLQECGTICFEVTLKSAKLKRDGVTSPRIWNAKMMKQYADDYRVDDRLEHTADDTFSALLDLGFSETKARNLHMVYEAWQHGTDIRGAYSRPQFYRHRRNLLKLGVDIGVRSSVTPLGVSLRTIVVNDTAPPEFYRFAA